MDNFHDEEDAFVPLVSKFMIPCLPRDYLSLKRLKDLFHEKLYRKITVVSAPEGFGKTLALASFAWELPSDDYYKIWFSIDRHDKNENHFWSNFLAALNHYIDKLGSYPNIAQGTDLKERDLRHLANELSFISADKPLVMFIDNAELIYQTQTFSELNTLFAMLGPNLHVFLSSRILFSEHDLSSKLFRSSVTTIQANDLAYTPEEISIAAKRLFEIELSSQDAKRIYDYTLGWPYAVFIIFEAIRLTGELPFLDDLALRNRDLADFFEYAVFNGLDENLQSFLVKTSILHTFNERLCAYMLDESDTESIISELLTNNTFIVSSTTNQGNYFYHPLFQQWLQNRLTNLSSAQVRRLYERSALWYLCHDEKKQAAIFEMMSIRTDEILDLVFLDPEERALFNQKFLMIGSFNLDIDQELTFNGCLLFAWAYIFKVDLESADYWIQKAFEITSNRNLSKKEQLSLDVLNVKISSLKNNLDTALKSGLKLLEDYGNMLSAPMHSMLTNSVGECYEQKGKTDIAVNYYRRAVVLSRRHDLAYMGSINEYMNAYACFISGNFTQALELCRLLLTTCPADYPVYASVKALSAQIYLFRCEFEKAQSYLSEASSTTVFQRNTDMYFDLVITQSWYMALNYNQDKADFVLLEAIELYEAHQMVVPRGKLPAIFAFRAYMNYLLGRIETSRAVINEFSLLSIPNTARSDLLWRYTETLIEVKEGDLLRDKLDEIAQESNSISFCLLSISALLQIAISYYQEGYTAQAYKVLSSILAKTVREDFALLFIVHARQVFSLLVDYLREANVSSSTRKFIRNVFKLYKTVKSDVFSIPSEFNTLDTLVSPLTARELEVVKYALMGYSQKNIAEELHITLSTVKSHLSHIYQKFDVGSFDEMADKAISMGFDLTDITFD